MLMRLGCHLSPSHSPSSTSATHALNKLSGVNSPSHNAGPCLTPDSDPSARTIGSGSSAHIAGSGSSAHIPDCDPSARTAHTLLALAHQLTL